MLVVFVSSAFCGDSTSFSYQLEKGSRTIVYEVSEYGIMEKKPYQIRVKKDTDEKASIEQMLQTKEQPLPWRYSDEVQVRVDVGDDSVALEYKVLGSKREDTANTHIYVLHPEGSRVLCGGQEAIRLRGTQESRLSLVPAKETGLYKAADRIDSFLQAGDTPEVPTSKAAAGQVLLKSLKPEQDKNAYERLLERVPGTWGFAIVAAMRGSEYVLETVEKERRETLLKVTDGNYSLTKIALCDVPRTKDIFNAKSIGRHIDLGFEQTFGKPVYLIVARVGFAEEVNGNTRYSYLKNVHHEFALTKKQGIEGDTDGILGFLQGTWAWQSGGEEDGDIKQDSQSFEFIGNRLTVRGTGRPAQGTFGALYHGREWRQIAREYSIVTPIEKKIWKKENFYTITLRDEQRDRTELLHVVPFLYDEMLLASSEPKRMLGVFRNRAKPLPQDDDSCDSLKGTRWAGPDGMALYMAKGGDILLSTSSEAKGALGFMGITFSGKIGEDLRFRMKILGGYDGTSFRAFDEDDATAVLFLTPTGDSLAFTVVQEGDEDVEREESVVLQKAGPSSLNGIDAETTLARFRKWHSSHLDTPTTRTTEQGTRAIATEAQMGLGLLRTALRATFAQTGKYNENLNGNAIEAGAVTAIPGISDGDLDGAFFDTEDYAITSIGADKYKLTARGKGEADGIVITLNERGEFHRSGL